MKPDEPFDDGVAAHAVIAADGTLTGWSEGARRLLGHTAADVVGRPAAELLADTPKPPPVPIDGRWSGMVDLRHRDGHTVSAWVLAHRRPPDGPETVEWVAVSPPDADAELPDDPLVRAAVTQSPCATMIFDDRLRLRGLNDAMADLLGLPGDRLRGLKPTEIGSRPQNREFEENLRRVLSTGRRQDMQVHMKASGENRGAHAWLARIAPLIDESAQVRGVCVTAHDFSDQYRARERLQLVNEASVRIGTTLGVTRTAQEMADVCVPALADFVSVDLLDVGEHGGESTGPPVSPVRLRRAAHQSVNADSPEAVVKPGEVDVYPESSPQAASLILGHAIVASTADGALEQWLSWDPDRFRRIREYGIHSTMSVPIQARGTTLGVAVFTRFRRPEAFTLDDVLLAEEVTARAAVCIDNARRYSRERETTLTLQRSLLPRTLPRTAAVEAASRYLPAIRSGVGGDWFDVIPLSGMRVAMVVGDVVGHGIQASATMGRLRTAVRTLADIDLAPDELLTHLDDLVVRLSQESGVGTGTGEVGATCLYAVYDPVSRRCTLARAGHPLPLLVPPDGPARQLELPSGPPLGVGGLPFEAAEVELREGSVLSFHTDGLLASRERDVDASQRMLREALSVPSGSLDEICDRVLRALLPPGGSADDVALLLARTRGLPASQVATWDIPADPALVAPVRKQVVDQLDRWGLIEATFTAELVVSELVTNAIRYGAPPIRLRLIHDGSTLICEVSDTNHTAPHLRRAKTWDEGGRGLLLVAQLTQRWGSRHTTEGKTIWAELALLDEI
ncbi:SpoIIE family protein phosphatase [Streptomyces sp. NPDC019990]|uniref:SpoIIE family protein phosphatase n=1 Tax=Streptomyces sp. NPDC019990 TaxID=3154693 RepID=UPI0033D20169